MATPNLREAVALHRKYILADGHNDLPWALGNKLLYARTENKAKWAVESVDLAGGVPELHTDIPRLRKGGVSLQFWSVYSPTPGNKSGLVSSEHQAVVFTLEQIDRVKRLVHTFPDTFELCTSPAEARAAFSRGRIASAMGAEGGHQMACSMGTLRMFYDLGVRYMTLTHNGSPPWADAAVDTQAVAIVEPQKGGLTNFGKEVVKEMNRMGMMVDLSHVHAETMRVALGVSRAPCIYSHSSARGVCPHPRNVPDDILPLVKANNGVIMVTFVSKFVSGPIRHTPEGKAQLYEVANHICHIRDHIGIDHIGLGGDYDGCTELPVGLEDVSCYPRLTAELLTRGFAEDEIKKLLGGNILRVWEQVEKVSAEMKAEGIPPSVATIAELDGDGDPAGGRVFG